MTVLTTRFEDALRYAMEAHSGQFRKGTPVPYVAHVLGVTALALEFEANETEAVGALLHDVAEDCGGADRLADVQIRFGKEVADIVLGCSDTLEEPKPKWLPRKKKYIEVLPQASPSVGLVVACDKLHNVRSLTVAAREDGEAAWQQFKGGREGTLWYYRAALSVLAQLHVSRRLINELRIAVEELHRTVGSTVPISDVQPPDA